MAGTFYPPAFAALTRWWGPRRVRALTALTLLAGLASTVFAPLTAALLEQLGWRHTYLVLAAVLGRAHHPRAPVGPAGPLAHPDDTDDGRCASAHAPDAVARSRAFLFLVAAVALGAFTAFAVVVNQVPLLIERGMSTSAAAWALGLGGLGQVLGRLGYRRLVAATTVRMRGVLILALAATATALLAAPARPRCAAHRRRDARRRRPRRVHPAAGHRDQRPLGRRPLRPPQRPALRSRLARHRVRTLGRRRPRPGPRRLPPVFARPRRSGHARRDPHRRLDPPYHPDL